MSNPNQVRVILWTTPRSLSTAFLKSLSTFENAELFQEPFVSAALFGTERNRQMIPEDMNNILESMDGMEEYTFDGVKKMLEEEYPDKELVFCKDGAQFIYGHFDKIPTGYNHVFLTRKPSKVLMSTKQMMKLMNAEGHESCRSTLPGTPHFQLHELVTYIREKFNQTTLIIDADDLQAKPKIVMKAFCDHVGLPYSDKMLTWNNGPDPRWHRSKFKILVSELTTSSHDKVFDSTGFDAHIPTSERPLEEMDEATRNKVVEAQPYYDKLMTMKLKV